MLLLSLSGIEFNSDLLDSLSIIELKGLRVWGAEFTGTLLGSSWVYSTTVIA